MKSRRIFILTLVLLSIFTIPAFSRENKEMNPIFMGQVSEVQKIEGENIIRIRAKGYLKGCQIYEEELVGIVSENTVIMPEKCEPGKKPDKNAKSTPLELQVEKGDSVFMIVDNIMTKSLPPQTNVKVIQVSKPN